MKYNFKLKEDADFVLVLTPRCDPIVRISIEPYGDLKDGLYSYFKFVKRLAELKYMRSYAYVNPLTKLVTELSFEGTFDDDTDTLKMSVSNTSYGIEYFDQMNTESNGELSSYCCRSIMTLELKKFITKNYIANSNMLRLKALFDWASTNRTDRKDLFERIENEGYELKDIKRVMGQEVAQEAKKYYSTLELFKEESPCKDCPSSTKNDSQCKDCSRFKTWSNSIESRRHKYGRVSVN